MLVQQLVQVQAAQVEAAEVVQVVRVQVELVQAAQVEAAEVVQVACVQVELVQAAEVVQVAGEVVPVQVEVARVELHCFQVAYKGHRQSVASESSPHENHAGPLPGHSQDAHESQQSQEELHLLQLLRNV